MDWLGTVPALRSERHFDSRVVRCFAERPGSVDQMLHEAVARNPDGEAVVCGTERLTYRALDGKIEALAARLAGLGVQQGDRVAILLANGIPFVAAFYAIVRIGAVAVLLNIREEPPELAYVIDHSGASVVIHGAELTARLPEAAAIPQVRQREVVGHDWLNAMVTSIDAVPAAPIAEEDLAAILYTSGTTGRPKGAMLTHLGIVHAGMIYEACMGLGHGERSVVSVPMTHVTGVTAAIAAMVRVAGTLIIMPAFRAEAFIALAAAERMTHTVMVPAMYNLCLLSETFESADLSSWRIGGYGGAPMPEVTIRRLAERLPNLDLMNAYGSTETTGPVVLMPPSQSLVRREQLGRPVPPCEVLVMDNDGHQTAVGETGEIWLRAPNVVKGYWNNPQATADGFVAGYWRSGDLGSLDAQGFVAIHDRMKDMINRGGFKIYSVEVENVLAAHPGVTEAAVVAKSCPVLGERVHAFVVPRTPGLALDALRAHCAGQLADYKLPETLTLLDAPLPRNAAGKVLKRELRAKV